MKHLYVKKNYFIQISFRNYQKINIKKNIKKKLKKVKKTLARN